MAKMTPLKAIREHCLECQGWTGKGRKPEKAVRECTVYSCRFYPYRMGSDPARKKAGNPQWKFSPTEVLW